MRTLLRRDRLFARWKLDRQIGEFFAHENSFRVDGSAVMDFAPAERN
jgi:hypothetical protein